MAYCEWTADGPLAPYVRCLWTLTSDPSLTDGGRRAYETLRGPWMLATDQRERAPTQVLPDGSVEIVFHLGEGMTVVQRGGPSGDIPRSALVGQLTRSLTLMPAGRIDAVGVRFRPAGASLFMRARMRPLRDRIVPLALVTGTFRGVAERLRRARASADRIRVLAEVLHGLRLGGAGGRADPVVFRAVDMIEAAAGADRIDELAARLDVSARRLLRLFDRHVGIPPKLLARVLRFQRVFRALRSVPHRSWESLAREVGYCDQAHLVHEFRAFTGTTPAAFLREWREVASWVSRDAA